MLEIVEIFSGIGTLTKALEDGISTISPVTVCAGVESEKRYIEHWEKVNPEGASFLGDICKFHPAELSRPRKLSVKRILVAGIPCTGHSGYGMAKNKLKGNPEGHSSAGHLFYAVGHYILQHSPDYIVFENVPGYQKSKAGSILKQTLKNLNYQFQEGIFKPHEEFETPTTRPRWWLLARRGGPVNWQYTPRPFTGNINAYLDPESMDCIEDEFTQSRVDAHTLHLDKKTAQGCNFSRTILSRTSTKVPTIPRTYYKIQPAGPFLACGKTYRMLRPAEIARLHGFPKDMEVPTAKRTAIEGFGQGVCYKPFFELGKYIGSL